LLQVPAGTRLFDERMPCRAFPIVLSGSVRVAKLAANGREILLYRVGPGEACVLSTGCLLGRRDYAATGTAECDITMLLLPQSLFDALLAENESFRKAVFELFSTRLAELMLLIEEIAFRRLDHRLAALLIARGPDLHVTHQALASELGSVREIVSRLLNAFEDQQLVALARENVRVLDQAGLARIAHDN
jgi:CRP/FNR family transcriptional regulator